MKLSNPLPYHKYLFINFFIDFLRLPKLVLLGDSSILTSSSNSVRQSDVTHLSMSSTRPVSTCLVLGLTSLCLHRSLTYLFSLD